MVYVWAYRHSKIMFLFLDSQIFFVFVQNNCCGIKLKAISCGFFIHRFSHLIVIDIRVKKDLLIIHSKTIRCPPFTCKAVIGVALWSPFHTTDDK